MVFLTAFLLACLCQSALPDVGVYESLFNERTRQAIDYLCPEVDICNTSAPIVEQNGILGDGSFISCCTGCSCHKDCDDMLNCCFPGGTDGKPVGNDVITTDLDRNVTSTEDPSIGPAENVPGRKSQSVKQCLYAQTGVPNADWSTTVPAYHVVSKPPATGCVTDLSQRTKTDGFPRDACGPEAVMPWGDLFPVYSNDSREIYKNAQCAQCHGVKDFDPFLAILVCDGYNVDEDRDIYISEHFAFLQQQPLSKNCFVAFQHSNPGALQDKRCYKDAIGKCSNEALIPTLDNVTMTLSEIQAACQTGFFAPVQIHQRLYKNAFCAICSGLVDQIENMMCRSQVDVARRFASSKLTYLLDTTFIAENDVAGKNEMRDPYPKACMRNGTKWVTESCRNVYCPTGQIRNRKGVCKIPSGRWYNGYSSVFVKLKYADVNAMSLLVIKNSEAEGSESIMKSFQEASPWPAYWRVHRIIDTSDDGEVNERFVAVELLAKVARPLILLNNIRTSITRPWAVRLGGMELDFKSSILEYSLRFSFDNTHIPWWKYFTDKLDIQVNISKSVPTKWTTIYKESFFRKGSACATKLFTCRQVSLYTGEYTVLAQNYLLLNHLNGKVMFDREFELVPDDTGELVPRVCLADSPLTLKRGANCSPLLYGRVLYIVVAFGLLAQRLCQAI